MCSVVCLTYNHEAYIAKALDGFVMQRAPFPFEVVIHDDASTDGTAAIMKHYEASHPGLFRCVYQTENQYSRRGHVLCNDVVATTTGRYVALCEGDDRWIDPGKLEKQVAFMEATPGCSMSFHAARIEYADGSGRSRVHRYPGRRLFEPREVILGGGGFYLTCTAMFRRDVFDEYPGFLAGAPVGDIMLALNAISKGTVGYIDHVMAVYNCGVPGSWTERARRRSLEESLEFHRKLEEARSAFDEYTSFRYSAWIKQRRSRNAILLLRACSNDGGCRREFRQLKPTMTWHDRMRFTFGYLYWRCRGLVLRSVRAADHRTGKGAGPVEP